MSATLAVVLGVAALAALGIVAVRAHARRHPTPCPSWLVVLLENPYMNAVAGSALILERARIGPGMAVLDVGCGPGRLALPAAERVGPTGRVVALDIQEAMLREIHAALRPAGLLSVTEVLPDPHFQSRRRVRRLAEAAGFRHVETLGRWYAFTMNFGKADG
jgi:hypothetical protein